MYSVHNKLFDLIKGNQKSTGHKWIPVWNHPPTKYSPPSKKPPLGAWGKKAVDNLPLIYLYEASGNPTPMINIQKKYI